MPPDSGDRRGLSLKPPCDAVEALRQIVEREHRCIARPIGCVVVWELLRGAIVQERTVHTFDLLGHGAAPTAYAWNIGDQSIVMPHAGEVCGPAEAMGAKLRWPRRPRR